MIHLLLEPVLHILILVPVILIFLRETSSVNILRIVLFCGSYLIYQIMLVLPRLFPVFDVIQSSWNWEGKILAAIWAILAWVCCRKYFPGHNFMTFHQDRQGFRSALLAAAGVVVLATGIWYWLGNANWDAETLIFQATLPGIDEEIMFRGVLLGLLLSSFRKDYPVALHPAVWITSILFGFMHALIINSTLSVHFDTIYFIQTTFAGIMWGWITLKSRSILLAVVSHNLSNGLGTLAMML